jgi:hypothetical protein
MRSSALLRPSRAVRVGIVRSSLFYDISLKPTPPTAVAHSGFSFTRMIRYDNVE